MVWEKFFKWLARKCKRVNESGFSEKFLRLTGHFSRERK
jgi:hypothetical protein